MLNETVNEARRQIEICNACRYCEGYCSVFPAINRERIFSDTDVIQLANLCHNCRGYGLFYFVSLVYKIEPSTFW